MRNVRETRQWVNLPVAAQISGCKWGTLIAAIHNGELRVRLCGTRWWFHRVSLVRWAERRRRKAA